MLSFPNRESYFFSRNPLDSETEAITVYDPHIASNRAFIAALLASGFRQMPENDISSDQFLPCPLGTFSNSSSKGTQGCTKCPAGKNVAVFSQYAVYLYIYANVATNALICLKLRMRIL